MVVVEAEVCAQDNATLLGRALERWSWCDYQACELGQLSEQYYFAGGGGGSYEANAVYTRW